MNNSESLQPSANDGSTAPASPSAKTGPDTGQSPGLITVVHPAGKTQCPATGAAISHPSFARVTYRPH